jgi:hypothetical protein
MPGLISASGMMGMLSSARAVGGDSETKTTAAKKLEMSALIFITAFRSVLHQTRNTLKSFGMLISAALRSKGKKRRISRANMSQPGQMP